MTYTPNLSLPEIAAAQAQKHVTHNEALRLLDAAVQPSVLDRDLTSPPAGAADGDRHIVGAGATGDWAGHDGEIAFAADGGWRFLVPREGWIAFAADEGALLCRTGSAWRPIREAIGRRSFSATTSTYFTTLPAGTATKIVFDVESWDDGGIHDTATGRFQPPAGRYCVSAVLHVGGIEDNTRLACLLYKNGALYRANYESVAGTGNQNASIDVVVSANGSDYFELYALAEGTSDKGVYGIAEYTWFQAFEV